MKEILFIKIICELTFSLVSFLIKLLKNVIQFKKKIIFIIFLYDVMLIKG